MAVTGPLVLPSSVGVLDAEEMMMRALQPTGAGTSG
jgi:hypothetical protein